MFLMLYAINETELSDCLYFLRYWVISPASASQLVTSKILKSTLSFQSSCLSTEAKSQDKNLNILRTKMAFKME